MNARTRSRRSSIAAMIADMREALEAVLGPISEPLLLPGGASKEAWAVDAGDERLLVRRAGGGVIHRHTLSLQHEFEVLRAAHEAGVKVPRPVVYIEDLAGREAFVMERLEGETIGRPIVREPGGWGAGRWVAASSGSRCRRGCRSRWRKSSRRSTPCRRSGSRSSRRRRSIGSPARPQRAGGPPPPTGAGPW